VRAEGLNGGRESLPVVERRDGIRRGAGRGSASGMNARLAHRKMTLPLGGYCTRTESAEPPDT